MPEHQQTQRSKKTSTIFQNQATPVVQTPVSNPYSIIQRARINPKSLTHADVMQLHVLLEIKRLAGCFQVSEALPQLNRQQFRDRKYQKKKNAPHAFPHSTSNQDM